MTFDRGVSGEFLCNLLLDENRPISERFRAFGLSISGSHPPALNSIIKAMRDDSTLLASEAAYKLGRMNIPDAIPALEAVVEDLSLHPIVRLKAAESLGAFGLETSVPVLETSFQSDPSQEVRDTCLLALTRIRELKKATPDKLIYFGGREPAPPVFLPIPELREVLLNEDNSLYERCSALFGLRLLCISRTGDTEDAFSAIIESLDAESPILRHHIAYCLVQLGGEKAFHALSQVLQNASEHPMVRIKAVEALNSSADVEGLGSTTYCECIELLKEFSKDPDPIVSQSCEVALRRLDYLGTNSFFEFMVDIRELSQRESAKKANKG
ncbi:unnamed protein product [Fraxinus pennsylvanica]|uniref:HEAT repeat domain-containing protein n=1 Tax=Fraxinus pennsylvanica TaxID=56036 RepID=A0AAD1ZB65_9LAMI|nr:unnamed protein product [Fraxinus pennsylvanica]